MSMKYVDSYLPEIGLLAEKSGFSARLCREDCAIVSAADPSRVLACRCRAASGQAPDPAACNPASLFGISASDLQLLKENLAPRRLLVLGGSPSPVLISCDLLESAGVLLMLAPHQTDTGAFLRALTALASDTELLIAPSLRRASASAHQTDAAIEELVSEWVFYASRIGAESERIGLCTRAMLIANFTGCHTETADPNADRLHLSQSICHRLSAFLLCAMLTLRGQNGNTCAQPTDASNAAPAFRLSLLRAEAEENNRTDALAHAPFLSHPEFRDLGIKDTPQGICFSFSLPRESTPALLCADSSLDRTEIVLIFEKIAQNALNS